MVARVVATPVLEWLAAAGEARGVIRGVTNGATYLELDGNVVALTPPGVALMPNAISVARRPGSGDVRAQPGLVEVGGERFAWDAGDPPAWEPRPRHARFADRGALLRRGAAILRALGIDGAPSIDGGLEVTLRGRGQEGARHLHRALCDRDAAQAAQASERLLGLGPGLTPEGDDILAATAATVAAVGHTVGFDGPERDAWLQALLPADRRDRTTALSRTLLELAVDGRIAEPVHALLHPGNARWRDSLTRLEGTGASTGRAYAVAVGGTMRLLAA
jgi:hypothetical protein